MRMGRIGIGRVQNCVFHSLKTIVLMNRHRSLSLDLQYFVIALTLLFDGVGGLRDSCN